MIIKDKTDLKIEKYKKRLGLSGDVYMVGHFIESLESHKKLIPTSVAKTIEEAETERKAYEIELEKERAESASALQKDNGMIS